MASFFLCKTIVLTRLLKNMRKLITLMVLSLALGACEDNEGIKTTVIPLPSQQPESVQMFENAKDNFPKFVDGSENAKEIPEPITVVGFVGMTLLGLATSKKKETDEAISTYNQNGAITAHGMDLLEAHWATFVD